VFVRFVQVAVDRFSTYRGWQIYLCLWLLLRSFTMYLFCCYAATVIGKYYH